MNLHVFIGEDEYLVSEAAKKIVGDGTGLEVIDSITATNADLQLAEISKATESLSTPPFLDPRKVTWWKNVHFLPKSTADKIAAEVKAAMEKFAARLAEAQLPENQHFIITAPHLMKGSKVAKLLMGKAEVISFAAGKPKEMRQSAEMRADEFAAELGLAFAPGAVEAFIAIVGTDTRSIKSEIGKMRDYLGSRTNITVQDIGEITSHGIMDDPEPWELTDAVGARDLPKALEAMKRYELENGFDIRMTNTFERLFRQLVDLKRAEAEGTLEAATQGMVPFVARKNIAFLRKWTLRELRIARKRFLDLREKIVSGTVAGDVLVVTELVRVLKRRV